MSPYKELQEEQSQEQQDLEKNDKTVFQDILKSKLKEISSMSKEELEKEERRIRFDTEFPGCKGDRKEFKLTVEIPSRRRAVQRRRMWFMFLAFLKAIALIFGVLAGLALTAVMLYCFAVFVFIPYYRTVLLVALLLPYYTLNLYAVTVYVRYQVRLLTHTDLDTAPPTSSRKDGIPWYLLFANAIFLAAVKGISWLWLTDIMNLTSTWDTEDHTFTYDYKETLGWRYDIMLFTTLGMLLVISLLCIYSLTRSIYSRDWS